MSNLYEKLRGWVRGRRESRETVTSDFEGISLSGPRGREKFNPVGLTLQSIAHGGEKIFMVFEGSKVVVLEPEACITFRSYFTDLNVSSDLPAVVTDWVESDGETLLIDPDDYGEDGDRRPRGQGDEVRDTAFVKIKTEKGYIDFTLHSEHNGYYGGGYYASIVPVKEG